MKTKRILKSLLVLVLAFAIYVEPAGAFNSLDAADGDPENAVYVDNNGNVGIGTTDPEYPLDVAGAANINVGSYGVALRVNGKEALWFNGNTFSWGYGGSVNNFYHNVCIGAGVPLGRIDIQGGADNAGANDPHAMAFQWRHGGYRHWIRTRHNPTLGSGNAFDFYVNNSTSDNGSNAPGTGSLHVMTLDSGNVGIGTTNPGTKLEVNGQIKITGGLPGAGKVLTSDANGLASWQTISDDGAGDNLGNHTATQNIELNGKWLSGDGGNEGLYVTNTGNVGIGTTSPSEKLQVAGTIYSTSGGFKFPDGSVQKSAATGGGGGFTLPYSDSISSSGNAFSITNTRSTGNGIYAKGGSSGYAADFQGKVRIKAWSSGATVMELGEGLDYAEGFDVSQKKEINPGSVLVIDPANTGKLKLSGCAYDKKVAGIVAGAKGLGSGVRLGAGQFDCPVALAGRVYCNVDATEAAVEPGDLLTTSAMPGYAMKAVDYARAQGAILGKAMERLEKGKSGQILVLVTLQ